jgi:hypothetical protein
MNNKNILLLTLVHPDFLPPVYAVAQTLRDLDYNIHILTFDSFVPAHYELGPNIVLESVGKHYDASRIERFKLRSKFKNRAKELLGDDTVSIISFCPFSYYCGLNIKKNKPLIYIALEIADFAWSSFFRSPLSSYRNLRALQTIHKADLIATSSVQRSAWLAGRCQLNFMPDTILNTAYLPPKADNGSLEIFKELVPADFLNKKIILYTGAVNNDTCILEFIQAFDNINNEQCVLIVNGMKDNPYCTVITNYVADSRSRDRIKLLPYLTREKVLSLQANAHIGINLTRENFDDAKSSMPAPNKLGEYLIKRLYIVGIANEYLRPYKFLGIASLAESSRTEDITVALKEALVAIDDNTYKIKIDTFVADYFCMQQQLKPVFKILQQFKQSS